MKLFSKKTIIRGAAILVLAAAFSGVSGYFLYFHSEPVFIAAVCPLSDYRGQSVMKGIKLYADSINRQGGINGRKIKLLFYDDKDNPKAAEQIAEQIAYENKAVLVIGHYGGDSSAAAGKIYKRNEIPAITASATLESVTIGNEWYFRTIPSDSLQGSFIASYMNRSLKVNSVSIIFCPDKLGNALVDNFVTTSATLGLEIFNKWELDQTDKNKWNHQIAELTTVLKSTEKPEMLFISMNAASGAKVITYLKDEGIDIPIFGTYSFGRSLLIEMKHYPKEQANPGYYTDGIYVASQYILEIGNPESIAVSRKFSQVYDEDITTTSACYYDAAVVAVEAVRKAGIQGNKLIRENRRKIRNALEGFFSDKQSVKGITGSIYFDKNRNTQRAYAIGVFKQHKLIPAFSQYHQYTDYQNGYSDKFLKKILEGEVIASNGILMRSIHLIFTTIEDVRLTHTDLKSRTCSLDFKLRFRYLEDFDASAIEFTNSASSIKLKDPIQTETVNGVTTSLYQVTGVFQNDFDFRWHPFTRQIIPIKFRHSYRPMSVLIFVPEPLTTAQISDRDMKEYKISKITSYPDVISKKTSLGRPNYFISKVSMDFSQFVAEIQFHIYTFLDVVIILLPLMIVSVIFRLAAVPSDQVLTFVKILMAAVVVTTIFYLKWQSVYSVDYITVVDGMFIAVYGMIMMASTIFFIRRRRVPRDSEPKEDVIV